jgi:hypothetical protein
LVIARSELRVIVVVSVAELLVVGESVTPAGAVTVAVLDTDPVAEDFTVALSVNVAVPPETRLTVVEMVPEPEAAAQLEPAEATQVQEAFESSAGIESITEAFTTSEGPLFVTKIV